MQAHVGRSSPTPGRRQVSAFQLISLSRLRMPSLKSPLLFVTTGLRVLQQGGRPTRPIKRRYSLNPNHASLKRDRPTRSPVGWGYQISTKGERAAVSLRVTLSSYWCAFQASLFPQIEQDLGPPDERYDLREPTSRPIGLIPGERQIQPDHLTQVVYMVIFDPCTTRLSAR